MIRNLAASVVILVVALLAYGQGVGVVKSFALPTTTQAGAADCDCPDAGGGCDPSKDKTCDWSAGCALGCGFSTGFTVAAWPFPIVQLPSRTIAPAPASSPDSISRSPPLRPPRSPILA